MTNSQQPYFSRDRLTWLAYLMLAYFAYLEASLGPLMPFLRAELDLNYTRASYHFSGFALGMVAAGLSADRVTHRLGRSMVFWGGAAGMAVGALGLSLARHVIFTVSAAVVMGYLGTMLLVAIQAFLADHHGARRAIAITESNVGASLGATSVPLLIGLLEGSGFSWRWSLVAAVGFMIMVAVGLRKASIPTKQQPVLEQKGPSGPLPRIYWAYWLVSVTGVAIEWCLVFWGADYLVNAAGLAKSQAATAMTLFFGAMVLGRYGVSRLTRRLESAPILTAALFLSLAGFGLLWLTNVTGFILLGFFLAGLGTANFYPLTLVIATTVASDQSDKASARISLGTGAAIFLAPLALGWSADRWGIIDSFIIVGLLLLLALVVNGLAGRYK